LVVIGGLASFGPLSLDLYLPALPRIAGSLVVSDGLTQLSVSGCLIGLAIGQFVFGPLGDRFGRRGPLLIGVAIWTLSAVGCAVAPSALVLIALRVLQGFGGAAGLVLSRAVIRDLYDSRALARAFAVVALLSNIAPAVAPVAGGGLLLVMSWRGLFFVLAGIGVLLIAGVIVFVPESLATSHRHRGGLRATTEVARSLLHDRRFAGAAGSLTLASAMLFTYISLSSFVLQHHYGLSPGAFALVFAANSAGVILTGSVTVRLLGHTDPGRLMSAALMGAVACTAALAAAVLIGASTWTVLLALWCAISTIGVSFPTATTLALAHQADAAGASSALLGGTQYAIGGLAGPIVSLAGETGPVMAIAMAVFALAAYAVSRTGTHDASRTPTATRA
jgi:DHA1 family bicyclomycin/chloramphenicol resistance-like MFS transporter